MKTQHTPGPWSLRTHGVMPGGVVIYFVNDMTSIATNIEADARLIAAAPELLEALQYALKVSEEGAEYDEYSIEWQSAIDVMRVAIAKATGDKA